MDPTYPKAPLRQHPVRLSRPVTIVENNVSGSILLPASYAKYFFIRFPLVVTAADAEGDGWIPTFSNVVHFEVDIQATTGTDLPETQLAPFYRFSPVIKTLRMSISVALSPQVFDLIRSFPLLEDLSLNHSSFDRWIGGSDDFISQPASVILPSNPPAFTGSLELSLESGIDPAASWLLSCRAVLTSGNCA